MHTKITLDLSHNNPFAWPHLPSPLEVEADVMEVDLPADYVFPIPMDEDFKEEDPEEDMIWILLVQSRSKIWCIELLSFSLFVATTLIM